jgi:hypothetical protein
LNVDTLEEDVALDDLDSHRANVLDFSTDGVLTESGLTPYGVPLVMMSLASISAPTEAYSTMSAQL